MCRYTLSLRAWSEWFYSVQLERYWLPSLPNKCEQVGLRMHLPCLIAFAEESQQGCHRNISLKEWFTGTSAYLKSSAEHVVQHNQHICTNACQSIWAATLWLGPEALEALLKNHANVIHTPHSLPNFPWQAHLVEPLWAHRLHPSAMMGLVQQTWRCAWREEFWCCFQCSRTDNLISNQTWTNRDVWLRMLGLNLVFLSVCARMSAGPHASTTNQVVLSSSVAASRDHCILQELRAPSAERRIGNGNPAFRESTRSSSNKACMYQTHPNTF